MEGSSSIWALGGGLHLPQRWWGCVLSKVGTLEYRGWGWGVDGSEYLDYLKVQYCRYSRYKAPGRCL